MKRYFLDHSAIRNTAIIGKFEAQFDLVFVSYYEDIQQHTRLYVKNIPIVVVDILPTNSLRKYIIARCKIGSNTPLDYIAGEDLQVGCYVSDVVEESFMEEKASMYKALTMGGWITYEHRDNWVHKDWLLNLKEGIRCVGVTMDEAFKMLLESTAKDVFKDFPVIENTPEFHAAMQKGVTSRITKLWRSTSTDPSIKVFYN